jgi:hypothetical protein
VTSLSGYRYARECMGRRLIVELFKKAGAPGCKRRMVRSQLRCADSEKVQAGIKKVCKARKI